MRVLIVLIFTIVGSQSFANKTDLKFKHGVLRFTSVSTFNLAEGGIECWFSSEGSKRLYQSLGKAVSEKAGIYDDSVISVKCSVPYNGIKAGLSGNTIYKPNCTNNFSKSYDGKGAKINYFVSIPENYENPRKGQATFEIPGTIIFADNESIKIAESSNNYDNQVPNFNLHKRIDAEDIGLVNSILDAYEFAVSDKEVLKKRSKMLRRQRSMDTLKPLLEKAEKRVRAMLSHPENNRVEVTHDMGFGFEEFKQLINFKELDNYCRDRDYENICMLRETLQ